MEVTRRRSTRLMEKRKRVSGITSLDGNSDTPGSPLRYSTSNSAPKAKRARKSGGGNKENKSDSQENVGRACKPSITHRPLVNNETERQKALENSSSPNFSPFSLEHSPLYGSPNSGRVRHRVRSSASMNKVGKGKSFRGMAGVPRGSAPALHDQAAENPVSSPNLKPLLRTPPQQVSPTLERVLAAGSEKHVQKLTSINTKLNTPTKITKPGPIDPTPLRSTPRKLKFPAQEKLVEPHYYSPKKEPKTRLSDQSPTSLKQFRDMRTGRKLSPGAYRLIPSEHDEEKGQDDFWERNAVREMQELDQSESNGTDEPAECLLC